MRYSPSTGGFYADDLAYQTLPGDLVVLTADEHAALLAGQAAGKRIVAGVDGRPTLADPVPGPAPVPVSISDRQFFQQLALDGYITQAEALAAVKTGDIPAALAGIVDAMPEADRFAAEMLLSGATVFERGHPLTVAIGAARGMTGEQVDAFFRAAAAL